METYEEDLSPFDSNRCFLFVLMWLLSEKLSRALFVSPHIADFTTFVLMWGYIDAFSSRTAYSR